MHQHTCGGCWGIWASGAVAGWLGLGAPPPYLLIRGTLFMARYQAMIPSFPWGINCAVCFACTLHSSFPRVGSSWPHPRPYNRGSAAYARLHGCMQFWLITSVSRLSHARLPASAARLATAAASFSFPSPSQTK
jgi:hypothetical protein